MGTLWKHELVFVLAVYSRNMSKAAAVCTMRREVVLAGSITDAIEVF